MTSSHENTKKRAPHRVERSGSLCKFSWLFEEYPRTVALPSRLCAAALSGDVTLMQWLTQEKHCLADIDTMNAAAYGGNW
jgi:hypothetical protein